MDQKLFKLFFFAICAILMVMFKEKIMAVSNKLLPTRGMRNNNPFNLRYYESIRWQGQIGIDLKAGEFGGFVKFDSLENGVRAGILNLQNGYFKKMLTIKEIVARYAPASDNNNEENYVNMICRFYNGFTPSSIPTTVDEKKAVIKAIVRMEQGFDAVPEVLINKYL